MRVWRVHPPHGVLKWVLIWMSFCFIVFKVGPLSQWPLKEATTIHSPCPPCECFCSLAGYPFDPSGVMKYSTLPCSRSYTRWFHDSLRMLVNSDHTYIHCTNELKSNNIYNLPIVLGVH